MEAVQNTRPIEKKKEYVIPLIKTNKWNTSDTKDDIDNLAVQEIVKETERQNEEWKERGVADTKLEIPLLMQNKVPEGYETDDRLDVSLRPNEPIETDYEEIPIEAFGMAMLKGMGWKPGQGIGKNNKNIAPVEAVLRPKGMGLGADRKQAQNVNDSKKGSTDKCDEGEEELIMKKGAYCLIEKRPHKDLYGVIQGFDEDNARLMIKLTVSGKVVSVSQYNIRLVDNKEYNKYSKYINKGAADRYKEKEEKRKKKNHSVDRDGDHEDRLGNGYSEDRNQSTHSSKHDRKKDRDTDRQKQYEKSESKKRKYDESYSNGSSSHSSRDMLWVRPKLRVRIIDKNFHKGKYFNSKVEIIDVFDKDNCVCQTDEGKVLEEISQSMMETLIPKTDSAYICIVNGKYRGQIAYVMERDKKKCKCLVQLLTNRDKVLSLDYDSVSFDASLTSDEEIKMAEDISMSEIEYTSVRTFIMEEEVTAQDELRTIDCQTKVKSPVLLEVDYTMGTGNMPRRLASRMDKRKSDQFKLTYEDELFMDEIVEEVEARELLEYLLEEQKAAEIRREAHLQAIRERARDLSYGPQSRVMKFGIEEARKRGGRG